MFNASVQSESCTTHPNVAIVYDAANPDGYCPTCDAECSDSPSGSPLKPTITATYGKTYKGHEFAALALSDGTVDLRHPDGTHTQHASLSAAAKSIGADTNGRAFFGAGKDPNRAPRGSKTAPVLLLHVQLAAAWVVLSKALDVFRATCGGHAAVGDACDLLRDEALGLIHEARTSHEAHEAARLAKEARREALLAELAALGDA